MQYCARNYSCLSRSTLCRPVANSVSKGMAYERDKLPDETRAQFKYRKDIASQQGWLVRLIFVVHISAPIKC